MNLLKKFKVKSIKPYLWIFSILITSTFYSIINHGPQKQIYSLSTDLDKMIPFISAFIIPYMLYMPNVILCLIIMCYMDEDRYYISLLTLNLSNFVCLITYLIFQTEVARPNIVSTGFLSQFTKFIYSTDNPYNCFPSIHVAATYSVIKGINRLKNMKTKHKIAFNIVGWLVIISTQFVKQHIMMDLLGSLVLVEGVYKLVQYLFFKTNLFKKVNTTSESSKSNSITENIQ